MKPGELERTLSRLATEAATARDRLAELSREIDAVRAVITEIAGTIRDSQQGDADTGPAGEACPPKREAKKPTRADDGAQVEAVSK